MPEIPIHALEAPVMPTVLPKQLLPATRKHPADLGVMDNRPPS